MIESPPFTRRDYLEANSAAEHGETFPIHRRYYAQFVNDRTIAFIGGLFGPKLLKSTDKFFNDIELGRWDRVNNFLPYNRISKELEDHVSVANLVCIAKEAGRQWVEQNR